MWRRGDVVAVRDVWFGEVWRAAPAVVVADGPDATALCLLPGSEDAYPVDDEGREVRIARPGTRRAFRRTTRVVLALYAAEEPWSIWHFFNGDGSFDLWYVNFEERLGRGPSTLDYRDHKLDLLVRPDGSQRWKDEDELEEAARLGLVDTAAVRADADRVLRERPWPTGWEEWRPDPSWTPPRLPGGWETL